MGGEEQPGRWTTWSRGKELMLQCKYADWEEVGKSERA